MSIVVAHTHGKKMSLLRTGLLCLFALLSCCEAYKVLVVFPIPGKSHGLLGDGFVRHLLKAGHEVTYITPYTYKTESPNFRAIDVSSNANSLPEAINIKAIMSKEIDMMDYEILLPMFFGMAKMTIDHEKVQKLLQDPNEQFDVVISEWMFSSLASSYAAVFNCPLIWSSSIDVHWALLRLVDQTANPSYTGDSMSLTTPPFTFIERVRELYIQLKVLYMRFIAFEGLEKEVYDNTIAPIIRKRGRQPPSYYDVQYNGSLVLANTHVSLSQATPIPQSVKAIGGYHIEDNVKGLSQDLQKIMDSAKNGVIYFSMGSNLKSKDIPKELKENLLKMFGALKQTVLWKFEEDLPNKPKNIHLLTWAPQAAILSHLNTILFITHGGLLSTIETINFGVPVIGIPVFADQFLNVARAVQRGYALKVDLSMNMAADLKVAIEELTTNRRYAETAKELSMIYHDRPILPGKELVHWVEHVVKTNGAPHLRSPALHVPFYQKLFLDLIAVILVLLLVIVKVLKCTFRLFLSKNKTNIKKKNH